MKDDDAISRQAVLDAIDEIDKDACMNEYHAIVKAIEDLPSVQPILPRGHWIMTSEKDELYCYVAKCSVCGMESINNGADCYCPNCGADMRESEEQA